MNQSEMVQSLRAEIAKLQQVLDLLLSQPATAEVTRRPGRPRGSVNQATSFNPEKFAPKKRTMSAEGKARIAAAQKKRWAAQKPVSTNPIVRKQIAPTEKTSKTVAPEPAKKFGRLLTVKKSAGAGKKTGAVQKRLATVIAKKTATKKTVAKKTVAKKTTPMTKRPAKPVTPGASELQTL